MGNEIEVNKTSQDSAQLATAAQDRLNEGRELLKNTIQDLKGLREFFKANWHEVIGAMMSSAVTAYMTHSSKQKDEKLHS